MNIKRAFLAAAAVLMVPGFALAQTAPTTFDTNLVVDQDYGDTVTMMLSCNAGVPLEQSFDVDADNGVIFVVEELVADANTVCTITLSGLASGLAVVGVNVGDGPELGASSCTFIGPGGDASGVGTTTLEAENSCDIWAQAEAFTYRVEKSWVLEGGNDFPPTGSSTVEVTCHNVSGGFLGDDLFTTMYTYHVYPSSDSSKSFSPGAPSVDFNTWCSADESNSDSAIEADNGCSSPTMFDVGDVLPKSCEIQNTVFFEGIPTLSQYGLAIMALLMLGVGFVGFRRFV